MNKRIASLLLCFAMVFAMLATAVPALAAPITSTQLKIIPDKTTASPGDIITYTIVLGPVSDMGTMQMDMVIPTGLTYVEGSGKLADNLKNTLGYDDTSWTENTLDRNTMRLTGMASAADYESTTDTELAKFKCKVEDGATGTLEVGLDNLEFYSCQTWEDHTSRFSVAKTAVTITSATHPAKPTIKVTGTYTYNGADQTATVTGYDSTTMNITGNVGKKAGSYTVSVTSKTGQWADGTSAAVTKAWTIEKANPTVTNPTGLTGTKGNALSTVTLPSGWAWKAPATVMNTTGNQSFAAVYTPTDTANYNTKEATLTVAVSEPPATHPAKPTIHVAGTYTYNGADQTAAVTGYDSATMNITGNVGKNAGSYTVSVTSKTGQWADGTSAAVTKAWTIEKANPTVTNPTGLTGTKGNALSTVTLPTGWAWKTPTTVMNTTGNQSFAAVYTPTDTENYNTKEANLTVAVSEPSATHPAKPTIHVTGTYTYNGADQTAAVTGYDSTTMNIAGNVGKNAGSYTVSVTSKTGQWADGTSAAVTKAWTIEKANPTVTNPTGLTGTKGNALSTVTLPTGWAWKTPTTVMNTTGNQSFAAVYTPTDTENYNTKEANLTVAVSEPSATHPAKPTIHVTGTYTYNGADQTAAVTGYDSATMNITGNVGKNAGSYTVSVTSKTGQWADGTSAAVTKAWTIEKANPTGTPKYTSITKTGKTLADAALTTTGADFSVPGTVKWIADDGSNLADTTAVAANTYYKWLFTPTDTTNYETITGSIRLYYKSTGSGSSYTYYTIKVTVGANGSVSPSGNVSVRQGRDQTFTITPNEGYVVSKVLIDGTDVGAVKSYTFENVKRSHTIEAIFMKAGAVVDVPEDSYYEEAVKWAMEKGITIGTDATHFTPDGICTRAQAVTFFWRAAGSPAAKSGSMPFTDVKADSYYYDAVLWAVENGIVKGTSATTFSPDLNCSRAQIVTLLWRSEKSPAAGTVNPFTDVKPDAYYADAVLWAVKESITKGTAATTFSPDDNCTRAQIVTFIYRTLAE